MMSSIFRSKSGFSLIEILVVLVIMGLVTTAIMSLFQNTQQTAYTQDDVVDLQQNLRIAADVMARDIMLAGFLIPKDETPLSSAPDEITAADNLVIRTASTALAVGVLAADKPVASSNVAEMFSLSSSAMVDLFSVGDNVRIIRTPDHEEYVATTFTVQSTSGSTMTLADFSSVDANFKKGDLIVKVAAGSSHPETVSYSLDSGELKRTASGGTAQVVADKIASVDLTYLLDDGSEEGSLSSPLEDVAGVMVRVVGNSFDYQAKSNTKARGLVRVVMIRNR